MQLASCRIFINEGQDVAGINVTPAEVVVLRKMHMHNVKSDPIKQLVITGDVEGRSNAAEKRRLLSKYFGRLKNGTSIVESVYPGDSPNIPQDFDGIWPMPKQDVPIEATETIKTLETTTLVPA